MSYRRRKTDHPGWAVARLAVVCIPLTVLLWRNSIQFDWSEWRTILEFAGILAGVETVRQLKIRSMKSGE